MAAGKQLYADTVIIYLVYVDCTGIVSRDLPVWDTQERLNNAILYVADVLYIDAAAFSLCMRLRVPLALSVAKVSVDSVPRWRGVALFYIFPRA
jgi:hypothetical protein